MQLAKLKKSLSANASQNIRFVLPTGSKIPPHAHVTEVARIDKKFIDCGGTQRTELVMRASRSTVSLTGGAAEHVGTTNLDDLVMFDGDYDRQHRDNYEDNVYGWWPT